MDINSDCRTEDGITIGLIDSIISIARVLKSRNFSSAEVNEAVNDLKQDEDLKSILELKRMY